jgi:glycosyltransferase involved in cell wall biosynthesis
MTELRVSVVICAYTENRWAEIHAAVESVRQQTLQPSEIILVVDHNPTLLSRLMATLPRIKVIANSSDRGLSGGRNTGVALASGEIIAFLDDDATADPDWLKYLVEGYSDHVVAGVGGLTLPTWQTQRPRWFPQEFDWVVGCTYVGMPTQSAPVRNLMGDNMSFRREVFEIAGRFDTTIGRSAAKRPLAGEETEFCIRLRQRSPESVLLFDNRAAIHHLVPAARCQFSYFRSRCFAEGFSKAQVAASVGVADGLSSERRYTYRTLPRGFVRGLFDTVRGDLWGLARAGAIIAGLSAATVGYALGSLTRARFRQRQRASI